ncbi:MAG: GNAT family N-acetyltransferase [Burkholderiaceae bacterium]
MITIARAQQSDIEEIARLHEKVFIGFFLTSLGRKFLQELYAGFAARPHGILLVARDGKDLIGFAAGTTRPQEFFSSLRRQRGVFFLARALPAILRNPMPVGRKLVSAFFYRGDPPASSASGALLSSIGVAAGYRGRALADQLLDGFEKKVAEQGIERVYLTTDAANNDRVNGFYRKNGYSVECRFTQNGGRPMLRYIKNIGLKNNDE